MLWSSVLFMEPISDVEHATAVAGSVSAGLDALRGSAFWKIDDDGLLTLAGTLERVGQLVHAAQIHLTGELDTRRVCERHAAASTAGLLRRRLYISPGDAAARVRAACAVLPRDLPTGGETPPVLPELRAAVDAGTVGVEQIRTVVSTMRGLPAGVEPELREMVQASLVSTSRRSADGAGVGRVNISPGIRTTRHGRASSLAGAIPRAHPWAIGAVGSVHAVARRGPGGGRAMIQIHPKTHRAGRRRP